jgi:hypothetical protein
MRGIVKVVIGGLIVLAIIIAAAVAINVLLHRGSRKSGTEATYSFNKTGFAVTYDSKLLKLEIDPQLFNKGYGPVYFVSRLGPRELGPQGARSLPTSPDSIRVQVVRPYLMGMTLAATINHLLTVKPFGSTIAVRYHKTTVNGMSGVTCGVNLSGTRSLLFVLYSHGFEVDIMAGAAANSPPAVWPALEAVARSVRPTP